MPTCCHMMTAFVLLLLVVIVRRSGISCRHWHLAAGRHADAERISDQTRRRRVAVQVGMAAGRRQRHGRTLAVPIRIAGMRRRWAVVVILDIGRNRIDGIGSRTLIDGIGMCARRWTVLLLQLLMSVGRFRWTAGGRQDCRRSANGRRRIAAVRVRRREVARQRLD